MTFETVAIVGVGLIGGSFALSLRAQKFPGQILGVDFPPALAAALHRGVIDAGVSLTEAAARADLIYLAQPVGAILETLPSLAPLLRPEALVTDAGSTKRLIVERAAGVLRPGQFMGGHPLAGKESRGVASAVADLFRDRAYVLTPGAGTEVNLPPVQSLQSLLAGAGARVVYLDAATHDQLVACTSHVPQLASTALSLLVGQSLTAPEQFTVSGPGLLDMTRLALSNYDVWQDILLSNDDQIRHYLRQYIQLLQQLEQRLGAPSLQEDFAAAAATAVQLRQRRY